MMRYHAVMCLAVFLPLLNFLCSFQLPLIPLSRLPASFFEAMAARKFWMYLLCSYLCIATHNDELIYFLTLLFNLSLPDMQLQQLFRIAEPCQKPCRTSPKVVSYLPLPALETLQKITQI